MSLSPCLLMVAPNGARRVYHDHPAIPLTPEELARDAQECLAAGASAMPPCTSSQPNQKSPQCTCRRPVHWLQWIVNAGS